MAKRSSQKMQGRILKAAGEVLAKHGLEGFGVNAVAERAGCGKPLVYRYFGDKAQVLLSLVRAKTEQVSSWLDDSVVPPGSPLTETVFKQIQFARILSSDPVLRALFRVQLCGGLLPEAAEALDRTVPMNGNQGTAGAAEAFLMAGINYVLMLKDSQSTCLGAPIATAADLAAFERAFVALAGQTPE